MCLTPVGKVVSVDKKGLVVDHKGKLRQLRSKLTNVKVGGYVEFSMDIAIDKIDPDEAEQIAGALDED